MPSIIAGGLARAFADSGEIANERERKKKAEEEAKRTRAMQMAAAYAGLSQQGISQQPGGNPLGDTGYYQDPAKTPNALAQLAAGQKRQQRIAVLRRHPDLADRSDDELAAVADDDGLFEKYAAPKTPSKKTVMLDEKGRPVVVNADDPQLPPDFVGPHATPPAASTIPGTPEWKAAKQFEAGLHPREEPLVQVQNPDGSVTLVPRSQAAGQNAPRAQGGGAGSASRAQRIQALANTSNALDSFESTLKKTGATLIPSTAKSVLQTEYRKLLLQMKEMYNLGVLNGPDLMLMEQILHDPTSIKDRALAGGFGGVQTDRVLAQVGQVRQELEKIKTNLAAGNVALGVPAPTGGRGAGPGTPKPTSNDPEFDALMAKVKRRTP